MDKMNMGPIWWFATLFLVLLSRASILTAAEMAAVIPPPGLSTAPLAVPVKLLMGPGPSTPHPRVLQAAALPMLGHMHPEYITIMDEVQQWLRYAFQTTNNLTLAVSGTGHAAMEAGIANIVEPGDKVLIGVNGIWGERMTDMAARYGADVRRVDAQPGSTFSVKEIADAIAKEGSGIKVLFLVHGESSTGTLQDLDGIGELCHRNNILLFVDTVCTLGGVAVDLDKQGVDVAYSGSQKCLGAPVGSSPFTMSKRATSKLAARKSKVTSYYLDMNLVGEYWGVDGVPRKYHHTGMVSNVYALRESLAMLAEESLPAAVARHRAAAEELWAGLQKLGLELFVKDPAARLPTVTTIRVPEGVKWDAITGFLMSKYKIEIAGGLGPTAGKVWRVGLMGNNARPGNVALLLHALKDALNHVGWKPSGTKEEL